jgi:hypothetical protein
MAAGVLVVALIGVLIFGAYKESYAKHPELWFISPISGVLGRSTTRRTK